MRATSSTPRAREVKNGFSMSGSTRAMSSECWRRSERAVRLGVYPSSVTARRTAAARSGLTVLSLSTRDTVAVETPASAATSLILVISPLLVT